MTVAPEADPFVNLIKKAMEAIEKEPITTPLHQTYIRLSEALFWYNAHKETTNV